jgi:serine/threonine-protein kinase RsbW
MTDGFESPLSRLDLACEPSAMRCARAHAKDVLLQWAVPPDVLDDALLIVAELATNAVRHSGGPSAPYDSGLGQPELRSCALVLGLVPGHLSIAFHDEGDQPPVLRQGLSLEDNGRGLQLIAGLTGGAWGWRPLTPQPGKSIWAKVAVPDHPYGPRYPPSGDRSPRESERAHDPVLRTTVGT